jgi:tripartite-type tricarboxylate transporter receptor subunit TctC
VRIIDSFGAGGGVDVIARALAGRLAAAWGQPAIVENHPGAGSTDTLATPELSQWLTQHDADPMPMSPAEFAAFVVSEAGRAAVLPPTP